MKRNMAASIVALLLLNPVFVFANITTMHTPHEDTIEGNYDSMDVGLDFEVTVAGGISILELGFYDHGEVGIIRGNYSTERLISTVIFDSEGIILAEIDFTKDDAGTIDAAGNYSYKSLDTPLVLGPGTYSIIGFGFDYFNKLHHSLVSGSSFPPVGPPVFNEGDGLISFVRSRWRDRELNRNLPEGDSIRFPFDYFDGPNMRFTEAPANPIPAPGAFMLGSMGVGFVSWLRRRRAL